MERFLLAPRRCTATPESRSDALFETFRRYLQVVNIELEPGDDPQVIFESLNGRGVALLPSDLVRNLVFMRASFVGVRRRRHALQQLLEAIRRSPVRQFHRCWPLVEGRGAPRAAEASHGLICSSSTTFSTGLEQEVHIGHLFQEFRKWWEHSAAKNAAGALAEMQPIRGRVSPLAGTGRLRAALTSSPAGCRPWTRQPCIRCCFFCSSRRPSASAERT